MKINKTTVAKVIRKACDRQIKKAVQEAEKAVMIARRKRCIKPRGFEGIVQMTKSLTNHDGLEALIEDIGKDMCHLQFLYPNAGKWLIQDRWGWEYTGDSLMDVFRAFQRERERQDAREKKSNKRK